MFLSELKNLTHLLTKSGSLTGRKAKSHPKQGRAPKMIEHEGAGDDRGSISHSLGVSQCLSAFLARLLTGIFGRCAVAGASVTSSFREFEFR
jgi:hypothetical protein